MTRVILITFAVLGWAWYEMSGGSAFVPGEHGIQMMAEAKPRSAQPQPEVRVASAAPAQSVPVQTGTAQHVRSDELVTRDLGTDLAALGAPAMQITPAKAEAPTPISANITDALAAALSADQVIEVEPEKLAALDTGDTTAPAVITDAMLVTAPEPVGDFTAVDYRTVTGSRVNLRGGPSTGFDVVTQLLQGEEVEILDDTGDGWVKLRALDGNDIGWMADSFLTASN